MYAQKKSLRVLAKRNGFRRAGHEFSDTVPKVIPMTDLNEEQIKMIKEDPNLVVAEDTGDTGDALQAAKDHQELFSKQLRADLTAELTPQIREDLTKEVTEKVTRELTAKIRADVEAEIAAKAAAGAKSAPGGNEPGNTTPPETKTPGKK